jgi:hypothetical protein
MARIYGPSGWMDQPVEPRSRMGEDLIAIASLEAMTANLDRRFPPARHCHDWPSSPKNEELDKSMGRKVMRLNYISGRSVVV